jgi:hypothetical protein
MRFVVVILLRIELVAIGPAFGALWKYTGLRPWGTDANGLKQTLKSQVHFAGNSEHVTSHYA